MAQPAVELHRRSVSSEVQLDTAYSDADFLESDLMTSGGADDVHDLLVHVQLQQLHGDDNEDGDNLDDSDDHDGTSVMKALLPQRRLKQTTDGERKFPFATKALLGNGVSLVIMVIGVTLNAVYDDQFSKHCPNNLRHLNSTKLDKECIGYVTIKMIRSIGLFMLSGGVTNWIAVEMLFRKVPGLIGSGVVVRHFEEIRNSVKSVVLDTFFEPIFMQQYIDAKTDEFLDSFHLEEKLGEVLDSQFVEEIIERHLSDVYKHPEGLMLSLMGISKEKLELHTKPFIVAMAHDFDPVLIQNIKTLDSVDAEQLHEQIERMMLSKVDEMSPQRVRLLIEEMIRKHLGWLVIWGNVFGAVIGFLAEIAAIFATGGKT